MYISNQHQFVYLGVPKTASRSVSQWLRKNFGAVRNGTHHSMYFIPSSLHKWEDVSTYLTFATIRNPYTRILSAWFSGAESLAGEFKNKTHRDLIDIFCRDVEKIDFGNLDEDGNIELDNGSLRTKIGFPRSQTHYLNKAKDVFSEIKMIKQENLVAEIAELPFVDLFFPMENIGKSSYGDWKDFYQDQNIRDTVWECYKRDFKLLNYSRKIL